VTNFVVANNPDPRYNENTEFLEQQIIIDLVNGDSGDSGDSGGDRGDSGGGSSKSNVEIIRMKITLTMSSI
jgi:hypothetical protein